MGSPGEREQESSLSLCARLYFVLLISCFSAADLLSVTSATCCQHDRKQLSERTENECEGFDSFKEVKSVPLSLGCLGYDKTAMLSCSDYSLTTCFWLVFLITA